MNMSNSMTLQAQIVELANILVVQLEAHAPEVCEDDRKALARKLQEYFTDVNS